MKLRLALFLTPALCLITLHQTQALTFRDFFGPRFNGVQTARTALAPKNALDSIHRWNAIAINASGLDHTPVAPGEITVTAEILRAGKSVTQIEARVKSLTTHCLDLMRKNGLKTETPDAWEERAQIVVQPRQSRLCTGPALF